MVGNCEDVGSTRFGPSQDVEEGYSGLLVVGGRRRVNVEVNAVPIEVSWFSAPAIPGAGGAAS
jgi:hypothetical protein